MKYYNNIANQIDYLNKNYLVENSKFGSVVYNRKRLQYGVSEDIFLEKHSKKIIIYLPDIINCLDEEFRYFAKVVKNELRDIIGSFTNKSKFLIVGLGNQFVTADNFGAELIRKLEPTRHLLKENKISNVPSISTFIPSVLGITGIETADMIEAICGLVEPNYIIVIDALCANEISRFCNTIQISTDGITPGAGIDNARKNIKNNVNGAKVIAIGVPFLYNIQDEKHQLHTVTDININKFISIYSDIISRAISDLFL